MLSNLGCEAKQEMIIVAVLSPTCAGEVKGKMRQSGVLNLVKTYL
jgi:hypothetical protein